MKQVTCTSLVAISGVSKKSWNRSRTLARGSKLVLRSALLSAVCSIVSDISVEMGFELMKVMHSAMPDVSLAMAFEILSVFISSVSAQLDVSMPSRSSFSIENEVIESVEESLSPKSSKMSSISSRVDNNVSMPLVVVMVSFVSMVTDGTVPFRVSISYSEELQKGSKESML